MMSVVRALPRQLLPEVGVFDASPKPEGPHVYVCRFVVDRTFFVVLLYSTTVFLCASSWRLQPTIVGFQRGPASYRSPPSEADPSLAIHVAGRVSPFSPIFVPVSHRKPLIAAFANSHLGTYKVAYRSVHVCCTVALQWHCAP